MIRKLKLWWYCHMLKAKKHLDENRERARKSLVNMQATEFLIGALRKRDIKVLGIKYQCTVLKVTHRCPTVPRCTCGRSGCCARRWKC